MGFDKCILMYLPPQSWNRTVASPPKIPSCCPFLTPPTSDNHWSVFHPCNFVFSRMSNKWTHVRCNWGSGFFHLAKHIHFTLQVMIHLLLFILLLTFPTLRCWALSSRLLWSLDMSPLFFEQFLSLWHHKLILARFVLSLSQSWNPSSTFQGACALGEPTAQGQATCPWRRGLGEKLPIPCSAQETGEREYFSTRKHRGGRTEGLGADMGSPCNSGWWRTHTILTSSCIYGVGGSWQWLQTALCMQVCPGLSNTALSPGWPPVLEDVISLLPVPDSHIRVTSHRLNWRVAFSSHYLRWGTPWCLPKNYV